MICLRFAYRRQEVSKRSMKSSCLRLHEIEDFKEGKSNHHKQTPYAEGKGIGIVCSDHFLPSAHRRLNRHRNLLAFGTSNHTEGKSNSHGLVKTIFLYNKKQTPLEPLYKACKLKTYAK